MNMMKENIKINHSIIQIILSLLVVLVPTIFFVLNGGLWGFNNLVNFERQFSIQSLIILIFCCIISFLFAFVIIKQLLKSPTYLFALGILSLIIFFSWGLVLEGGGINDSLGVYFIAIPAILSTLLVMFIDRGFVSKYGIKKVNKVERIIIIILLIPLIFQMISIRI